MREPILLTGIVAALLCGLGAIFYGIAMSTHQPRVYDCSMASFHPDIPPKVRKMCDELIRSKGPWT